MLRKFWGVHIHVTVTPAAVHNRICRTQARTAHIASFCSSLSLLFHVFLNIMNVNLGLNDLLKSRWFNSENKTILVIIMLYFIFLPICYMTLFL